MYVGTALRIVHLIWELCCDVVYVGSGRSCQNKHSSQKNTFEIQIIIISIIQRILILVILIIVLVIIIVTIIIVIAIMITILTILI